MKRQLTVLVLIGLAVVVLISVVLTVSSPARAGGATQIAGIALPDPSDSCDFASQGADFANIMTGDLEGCLYVDVDEVNSRGCTPGGAYNEIGTETFIGEYDNQSGTFETTYRFTAKFKTQADCEAFVNQQTGRCQHPIVAGSGTGVFSDVTGRLDFTDNIVDGQAVDFTYRGHLRW